MNFNDVSNKLRQRFVHYDIDTLAARASTYMKRKSTNKIEETFVEKNDMRLEIYQRILCK